MASDSTPSFEEFGALSPNERAEFMHAGVVREWDQLDPDEQALIRRRTAELRQRPADA